MSSPTVPVFSPETLERILPVAQRAAAGDVALTITSLESYTTGFLLNVRLDWVGSIGPLPGLTWTATDDRGGTYSCFGSGGSGGGGRPDQYPADARPSSWRMFCHFSPRIAPTATEIRLEPQVRLSKPLLAEDDPTRVEGWATQREVTNLGDFTIAVRQCVSRARNGDDR